MPYFSESSARGVAFWVTFAGWFVYVSWLLRSERAGEEDGNTSRVLLVCTVGALVLAFAATYLVSGATIDSAAAAIGGLVIAVAGMALGEWARRCLGRHYHPVVTIDDEHAVVTTGPYRLIRHPIYAGRLLSLAGLGLAMSNWLSLASCLILPLFGFVLRIGVEEHAMHEATGDAYAAYSDKTWRLLPRVW